MWKNTIETPPSCSRSRSIMQSTGSTPLDSLISATCLPSKFAPLPLLREEMYTLSHPVEARRLSQPSCSCFSSSLILSRETGSLSLSRARETPPSSAHGGSSVVRVVEPAVYGYTSQVTSSPRDLASSTSSIAVVTLPQLLLPAALRWLIWSETPHVSASQMTSSMEGIKLLPSPRMWVASSPSYLGSTEQSSASSSPEV